MSPYLFVLLMEYMSGELDQLAWNGDFNFHPRFGKLGSIHIYFTDDLLIYYRDDLTSIKLLFEAFMKIFRAFGLRANTDKISLYIDGVEDHKK